MQQSRRNKKGRAGEIWGRAGEISEQSWRTFKQSRLAEPKKGTILLVPNKEGYREVILSVDLIGNIFCRKTKPEDSITNIDKSERAIYIQIYIQIY